MRAIHILAVSALLALSASGVLAQGNNEFIEAREKLPSAVRSLPDNYKKQNAAALIEIFEELRKSYRVELKLIRAISGLDVTDRNAVRELARKVRDYHQLREYNTERTHCRNIDRIADQLQRRYETGAREDHERIREMHRVLKPLRDADNEFTDQLESLVNEALETIRAIESAVAAADIDAARAEQRRFVKHTETRIDKAKKALTDLNSLSSELIDLA